MIASETPVGADDQRWQRVGMGRFYWSDCDPPPYFRGAGVDCGVMA